MVARITYEDMEGNDVSVEENPKIPRTPEEKKEAIRMLENGSQEDIAKFFLPYWKPMLRELPDPILGYYLPRMKKEEPFQNYDAVMRFLLMLYLSDFKIIDKREGDDGNQDQHI